jgi:hypothetical protein
MSLADAIERNRARHAQKRAGVPTERRETGLRAFTINVITNPLRYMVDLGLEPPAHHETRTIYGISLADAKKRAGID